MADAVAKRIKELSKLREQRALSYGDTPKIKGEVMSALFPNGVKLKTPVDQARYSLLSFIVSKLVRYCNNFEFGHEDSLDDISVYAQILQEKDLEI